MLYKLQKLFLDYGVNSICSDSRLVKQGDAFFAINGTNADGNRFIDDAITRGASLVITEDIEAKIASHVKVIYVDDARIALAIAASIIYPGSPDHLIAVTGTNGKSSVISYINQLYSIFGKNSASIGTLGIESSVDFKKIQCPPLTTPDSINFRKILNHLKQHNIEYAAFEASSHGLDQERLYGIKVDAACFTSFSQDHLDYHKNMESYFLAKLKLFTDNLIENGLAIINSRINENFAIKEYLKQHKIRFISTGHSGDIKIMNIKHSIDGQHIEFSFQKKEYAFHTKIVGSFQAENLLIAIIILHNSGFSIEEIVDKLPQIKAVKGRLERITNIESNFHVFLDYAHTPDALEKSLEELQKLKATGKLKLIFGCGGDRDSTKRAIMGTIATKFADEIIITDDNPRNEDPAIIRAQILDPIKMTNIPYKEIGCRKEAIEFAISQMRQDDILLIAGKGHEEYQIIKEKKIMFSDTQIINYATMGANDQKCD